ncbi:MAG: GH3 auxin-responsive promoter family protein, partial [Oscillospiraceae bacterium]|nr:GH3 auxin-responsive promoter family protein [Oscillospiraceae bacterium]
MSFYGSMMKMMSLMGKSAIRSLDKMTKDPRAVQEELLLTLLRENKDTVFGAENGFGSINSIEDYQARVPIREYDSFAPYIERMVKGEDNILTVEHIAH